MRHRLLFGVMFVAMALGAAVARPGARKRRETSAALRVPYTEFTLANGLHVILHRDASVPVVSVNVWYHVGSGSEKPGRTGLCAPLRAPDVRRVEERPRRGVRHVARGRRRQQQRIDDNGSDELLHRHSGECAGSCAVSRIGSHGLSARHDDARARRWSARRRQERTSSELREPAVRSGVPRAVRACCIRRIIRTAGRRSARWKT